MTDVTWYRLSERAPTEADADKRGTVYWGSGDKAAPGQWSWDGHWVSSDGWQWRKTTPADYPPKPRKVEFLIHWPTEVSERCPTLRWTWEEAENLRTMYGGHIQRVEITEELP